MSSKKEVTEKKEAARDFAGTEILLPGDTYYEGPYLVFTAQYHLRRGFCCRSGCRHCPYKQAED